MDVMWKSNRNGLTCDVWDLLDIQKFNQKTIALKILQWVFMWKLGDSFSMPLNAPIKKIFAIYYSPIFCTRPSKATKRHFICFFLLFRSNHPSPMILRFGWMRDVHLFGSIRRWPWWMTRVIQTAARSTGTNNKTEMRPCLELPRNFVTYAAAG